MTNNIVLTRAVSPPCAAASCVKRAANAALIWSSACAVVVERLIFIYCWLGVVRSFYCWELNLDLAYKFCALTLDGLIREYEKGLGYAVTLRS